MKDVRRNYFGIFSANSPDKRSVEIIIEILVTTNQISVFFNTLSATQINYCVNAGEGVLNFSTHWGVRFGF